MQHSLQHFFMVVVAAATAGCAARSVVFATATTTGIDISASNTDSGEVVVGYRRFEGVTIPSVTASGAFVEKAYPVLGAYSLNAQALWPPTQIAPVIVHEVFASGRAATQATAATAVATAAVDASAPPPQPGVAAAAATPAVAGAAVPDDVVKMRADEAVAILQDSQKPGNKDAAAAQRNLKQVFGAGTDVGSLEKMIKTVRDTEKEALEGKETESAGKARLRLSELCGRLQPLKSLASTDD